MYHFTSDQFEWHGHRAVARLSDLLGNRHGNVGRFTITSAKTGKRREYSIDTSAAGYEDGWDGEFKVYTDNLWDGTQVTILND